MMHPKLKIIRLPSPRSKISTPSSRNLGSTNTFSDFACEVLTGLLVVGIIGYAIYSSHQSAPKRLNPQPPTRNNPASTVPFNDGSSIDLDR
jgi:hypothetical protein